MAGVVVVGAFDDLRARDVRFLEEAARLGSLTVLLKTDEDLARQGTAAKFPLAERAYLLNAVRHVREVIPFSESDRPRNAHIWAERPADACEEREAASARMGLEYRVLPDSLLDGFPPTPAAPPTGRQSVAVTGCYDWLHSGHVRFFEEAAGHGDLTVFVGNDACIEGLKGKGHPQFGQDERRYMVGAVRHVHQAIVSSGSGWLDADAEIRALKPDIFIVNEDGDKDCKRDYCRDLGIEYRVLKRVPAAGLPKRSSTGLRGF
ncbi:MAG: adenylyltransferase/cytidyltransferase family protein [Alphaproteobacteria bacterium]|nr:adenylyltransferase/cytidyltransferase family protein [Alphaproteobacteria bacterium]